MNKDQLLQKLKEKGFSDKIAAAFAAVDREKFFPEKFKKFAYDDEAFPLGHGATISQPSTIAFMLALLKIADEQKIMEVGSGSGYVLELLSEISGNSEIYGVEMIDSLVESSRKILSSRPNIHLVKATEVLGFAREKPFDRILVSAAGTELPRELIAQLAEGGILVCPVNNSIIRAVKTNGKIAIKEFPGFVFVPLVTK
ncbi:MAG: protein-L-isoaspartate O-methyltransferase [Patescibacteria group bacterium]|nr:protein-L-isoaspartate O-methyltransferase [Patescibacteria group bacterium]